MTESFDWSNILRVCAVVTSPLEGEFRETYNKFGTFKNLEATVHLNQNGERNLVGYYKFDGVLSKEQIEIFRVYFNQVGTIRLKRAKEHEENVKHNTRIN